jgi:ubiquitin-like 1-activating enzyme E1 A
MEAQTRLRNSKVLVINVGSLANEIIKNIVLAGIGSLTVLDANIVTESDLGAQFFLEESDVGKNVRATPSLFIENK